MISQSKIALNVLEIIINKQPTVSWLRGHHIIIFAWSEQRAASSLSPVRAIGNTCVTSFVTCVGKRDPVDNAWKR